MRSHILTLLAAAATLSVQAQNLQELADNMELPTGAASGQQLQLPTIPGAEVRLLGCDYEQLIGADGRIHRPATNATVRVCFTVTRGEESVTSRDYELQLYGRAKPTPEGANGKPAVIPDLLEWRGSIGKYELGESIICRECPELAAELAADIRDLLGRDMHVNHGGHSPIYLSLLPSDHETEASRENYSLHIRPEGVTIYATHPKGLYWGTRSLLQILKQGKGTAPCGIAHDLPRYAVRGFMLDVARLPMPLADLKAIIRTMAWYKMNELQLHLNDNYIFHEHYADQGEDPFRRSYAAFRLESQLTGQDGTALTAQDLHYSKADFAELVHYAARHNVRIVPEFDTPGHALAFTRVRPELIYQGPMHRPKRRCEMLDAANPEALRFASEVWDEYLLGPQGTRAAATFADCPVVHVGADEFFGDKEAYRAYADGILRHVKSRGYTPRIWGSLHAKPGKTPVLAEGVQMNLWSGDWARAWDSIRQGYEVINTADNALYIVPFADYYRMDWNLKWVYENWQVNHIHGQKLPSGHPQLLGAMFAIWQDESDLRHNGYMLADYWPSVTGSLDVLGERMWGQPTPPRNFAEHRKLVAAIGPAPRADILHRKEAENKVLDVFPSALPHALGMGSLGPSWHLTVQLTLSEVPEGKEQVLLSTPEGELLAVGQDGCIGFRRADSMWFSFEGACLPVGERVQLELIGKPGNTRLLLNGKPAGTLTLRNGHNRSNDLISTFNLPLDTLGESFHGTVHHLQLRPTK